MTANNFGTLQVARKQGTEEFHASNVKLPLELLGFWQWSGSDLVNNTLRGMLAEYLVACALGLADGTRVEWDAYDLKTKCGVKVEVKSASYIQSWLQSRPSVISFGVQPTMGWNASTNEYSIERKRQADVYVFSLLAHQGKLTLDPLDVDQWDFYVLPTVILDEKIPTQKQMGLATLLRLGPTKAKFGEIAGAIERLFPSTNDEQR